MKKYLILVFFFLYYINILKSQIVEYGIGVGFGGYFFNHQDKKIFENDLLKPTWRSSGGILGYVNLYSHVSLILKLDFKNRGKSS